MARRSLKLLRNIRYSLQLILDILQPGNLCLGLFQVEAPGVVGVELVNKHPLGVSFFEELVVVEVTVIGRDSIEVAHINGLGSFFLGEEGFVHLLSVTDADDFDFFLLASEEFTNSLSLGLDCAGRSFLDEDVSVASVLEGEEDQVHSFVQGHDEAGHGGLGEGDRVTVADLFDPQRNHGAAGAHDVAITSAADLCVS